MNSKVCKVALFVISYYNRISFVGVFIMYLHIKFHILNSNSSLVSLSNKIKLMFDTDTILLFYILRKILSLHCESLHVFRRSITINHQKTLY
jgi:hypothetical protein